MGSTFVYTAPNVIGAAAKAVGISTNIVDAAIKVKTMGTKVIGAATNFEIAELK